MLSENCSLPTVRSAIAAGPRRGSARELAACSAFAATLAVFAGCSKPVPVAEDIRPVRAMTVAPARATTIAELSGEVRPRIESKLGFQVGGRITSRRVEVGQRVAVGDVLATLDAVDYKLSAAASSAQLLSAQVDRDQQRTDYRRFEDLYRQGFISAADLERRKSQLDAAEAKYTQSAAQANVSGNQETYATLTAAQPGVVTGVDAEVGQVVAAGQSVIRIAQTSEKEVAIAIPENRLEALRQIRDVRVSLWAGGGELQGRVREIAPIADPATRTYPARITLLSAPASVALGMTATVTFEAPLPLPIVALPMQALLREDNATYVWLLDSTNMTVRRSAIEVATVSGNDF